MFIYINILPYSHKGRVWNFILEIVFLCVIALNQKVLWWSWSYGSWIYNYAIRCQSPLSCELESWSWRGVFDTTLCDKVCQWLAASQWFSLNTPGFLHQQNWLPWYKWNIVESGVKHHNPNLEPEEFSKYVCFISSSNARPNSQ